MTYAEPSPGLTRDDIRERVRRAVERRVGAGGDPSHARFPLPSGRDLQRTCLIEPTVACVGCGYCRSYGH